MSEPAVDKSHSARREIVTFAIGDQGFCIEIEHVLEIRGWTATTVMPQAPDYVIGLMNLRGAVLPVVDLSLRLGLGKIDPSPRHVIIIARVEDQTVGFLVEAVSDILTIAEEDMKPTPAISSPSAQAFIKGVYTIQDKLVRAVDIYQIVPGRDGIAA